MAPSPSKGKGMHKSSGKMFRKKEQDSGGGRASSSHSSNGAGSSKKEDSGIELKDCSLTLPVMCGIDHIKSLPRYNNLCTGEAISMEELDNLQLELELLASSMLVREFSLTAQTGVIEQMEKGKIIPRPVSAGKRLRTDPEQPRPSKKTKDNNSKGRDLPHPPNPAPPPHSTPPPPANINKVKCSIVRNEPLFDVPDLPSSDDPPRPVPPRNDITNRFWGLVDTYCEEMTADDIKMLEEMLASHNDDPEVYKIQPLGRHYTLRWAQEDILDEQKEGSKLNDGTNSNAKKKGINANEVPEKLLKEVDLNHGSGDDTAPLGPLTQRLIAGLLDESVLPHHTENTENKGVGRPGFLRSLGESALPHHSSENTENTGVGVGRPGFLRSLGLGSGSVLEKRLRKELQDHGIFEPDHSSGQEEDDEILQELKRCQLDLRAVAAHNHSQLTRLLKLARDALYRHDLKKKLRDAEAKVIESYKNISLLRMKKKPITKKDRDQAWKAIKDREVIAKQLDSINT